MHRRIAMSGLALVATTASMITGLSQSAYASGGTIKVAYQQYGANIALPTLMKTAAAEFAKQYPGWTVSLNPIVAPENPYYTKMDLESSSASTAPDVLYEDTFLVNSDVAAGYLQPMGSYLSGWPEWKMYSPAAQAAGKGANGDIYGVSMGTDTRGLWYNKSLLQKAGVAVPWHPKSWADIVAAAEAVKKADPGVTPMNVYSGVPTGEASSMQGFEMFLYGTNNWLYDSKSGKWEQAGAGWQSVLTTWQELFSKGLAETPQAASNPNNGATVTEALLPEGKLAIDLDGSWVGSTWIKGGPAPWPQWKTTMAVAAMPSENGQGPGDVSMSGGWLLSIGSHSKAPAMAMDFIKIALDHANLLAYDIGAGQTADRSDIATNATYTSSVPESAAFSSFVPFTHFRPAFSNYPKLSNEIQLITGQVMTGQSTPAQGVAAYNSYLIGLVGKGATEAAPM